MQKVALNNRTKCPEVYIACDEIIRLASYACSVDAESPVALIIDRTFNITKAYLTSYVFECKALVRKDDPNCHPTLVVLDFLHTGVKYEDFRAGGDFLHMKMCSDVAILENNLPPGDFMIGKYSNSLSFLSLHFQC